MLKVYRNKVEPDSILWHHVLITEYKFDAHKSQKGN